MEYKRLSNRCSINIYRVMLKGESMKTGQEAYNAGMSDANHGWEKRVKDCPRCCLDGIPMDKKPSVFVVPPQGRYPTGKTIIPFKLARKNKDCYLKLHTGDIYVVNTNTILDRLALKTLLDD